MWRRKGINWIKKTRTITVFDIQNDETKHNFEKLKSHFSQTALLNVTQNITWGNKNSPFYSNMLFVELST